MFIKNLFQREKFVLFSKKIKNKNNQNPFLVGFFKVVFGFFWVGFLLPTVLKVFLRKLKKASEKKNWETVERLKANKPKYSLGKSWTCGLIGTGIRLES